MPAWNCARCKKPLTPQQAGSGCPYCGSSEISIAAEDGIGFKDQVAVILGEKARMAKELANKHYQIETDLTRIIRYSSSPEIEADPAEPVKLLEENAATVPTGVMPLQFGPVPASGFHYPSVIIEVTPEEFRRIENRELKLPDGWDEPEEFPRPETN